VAGGGDHRDVCCGDATNRWRLVDAASAVVAGPRYTASSPRSPLLRGTKQGEHPSYWRTWKWSGMKESPIFAGHLNLLVLAPLMAYPSRSASRSQGLLLRSFLVVIDEWELGSIARLPLQLLCYCTDVVVL
jgi:hypothetical protein